jgi:hypothetical protein
MADLPSTPNLRRITIILTSSERDALRLLAFQERRDTRQQAALIIRQALEHRGLLPIEINQDEEVLHAPSN